MQSDRFAREIMAILALSYAARSRRLMRNPLGGSQSYSCVVLQGCIMVLWFTDAVAAPKNRIKRGLQARGAVCGSRRRFLKKQASQDPWCCV
jgi:hypothetical protein